MSKVNTFKAIKKYLNIARNTILWILLLFLITVLIGFIPAVQTYMASKITDRFNQRFSTNIAIDKANLTFSGSIALNKVLVNDHRQDTLLFVDQLKMNALGITELVSSSPHINSLKLNGVTLNIKTYEKDSISNLNYFFNQFEKKQSDSISRFSFKAGSVRIANGSFNISNENNESAQQLSLEKINLNVRDLMLDNANISAQLRNLTLSSSMGIDVTSVRSDLSFVDQKFSAKSLILMTEHSSVKGQIFIDFESNNFQTAQMDISLFEGSLGLKDLHSINSSFAQSGQIAMQATLLGSINDFEVSDVKLSSTNTRFEGSFQVSHLFDPQVSYEIRSTIDQFTFSETSLRQLLPTAFGSLLPSSLKHLDNLNIKGENIFSPESITSNILIQSEAGNIKSNLLLKQFSNIDNAVYKGKVSSSNFNLGTLLNNNQFGAVDFDFNLQGKGLTVDLIDSSLTGAISSLTHNQYQYQDILISGNIKNELFEGEITSKDPNLNFSFDGLIDFSQTQNYFDFNTSIENVNLYNLGWDTDTLSSFSGDVSLQIQGNSQEDIIGDFMMNNARFVTSTNAYNFEKLELQSRINEGVRVISVNSEDVLSGILIGEFTFSELPKLIENSIRNTYSKKKLHKVSSGQYLSFNFNVNTKIANALYPNLILDDNTYIKGKIDADKSHFKLSLRIPSLQVDETKIEQLNLQIDNKNSLFNTYLEVDDVRSKYVKVKNVNLINTFVRDTLFFRTEYDDITSKSESYEVNFYHTLDSLDNSVIGFKYSEFNFRNNRWVLNTTDSSPNKILIESKGNNIEIQPFRFKHENEELIVQNSRFGIDNQDLNLDFKNVQLKNILPEVSQLDIDGNLNGNFQFVKNKNQYIANSSLQIAPFSINDYSYETATIQVKADDDLQRFGVLVSVQEDDRSLLNLEGSFAITGSEVPLDMKLILTDFPVAPFSPLGKNTVSDFRGTFSGGLQVGGSLSSMTLDGNVKMNQSGLSIPYLGVDFDFTNTPNVLFSNQSIQFKGVDLKDTDYGSKGFFNGSIDHKNFKNWTFDLNINSDRLLMLHTKETPGFLYYGDAFLSGFAHLYGPSRLLTIDVEGATAKGTSIAIPISDATKIDKASYIKFIDKRVQASSTNTPFAIEDIKGLTLNFDLDVTKDAEVAVVVDPETGSLLKGRGAGNILMEINTNGRFNMWGDFIAYEGIYNFKNLGIFEKEFTLKEGGTIVWDGDPLQAQLNMEAVYSVPGGANPALLSEDLNLNRKIPTQVTTTLTGNLLKLDTPLFSIDFPNASGAIKSELEYRLSDREKRQLQAVSLLVQGFFISEVSLSSITSETFYNNVFQKVSGIFDSLFADEDGKINVGLNYLKGDRNAAATLKTRDRLGLTLTTKISDRILLNGKFGVPVSGIEETVFVGDVEIEFLLSKDGNLRARIFNKENEYQYIGDELGFTQGGGLSYQVNFDSFKDLLGKMIRKTNRSEDANVPATTSNSPYIQLIPKGTREKK